MNYFERNKRWEENRNYAMGKQNIEKFKEYLMPDKMQHQINDAGTHLEETDKRPEFVLMKPYLVGLGMDFGSGSNRLSPTVLSIDRHKEPGVDLVWNIVGGGGRFPLPFSNDTFDFIFTSHVLEDFELDEVQFAFDELLRMIKPGGYLITIGPDMQNGRYPKWDEVFTETSPEVIRGERKVGEIVGNPSHRFNWGIDFCYKLKNESRYKTEVVCEDTIPHSTMSVDFVVRKL